MKKFISVFVAVSLVCAASCGKKKDASGTSGSSTDTYALVQMQNKLIELYLEENGAVTPRASTTVKFNLTGKVVKLYKEAGDAVKVGDILAGIQPDITQIQSINETELAYQKAMASLQSASNDMVEAESLYQQHLIAKASYDTIVNDYNIALSETHQALLELQSMRETAGSVTSSRQVVSVRSPAAGTIISRDVDVGDYVLSASAYQSGTDLFTIANTTDMIVEASINEVDIVSVKEGAEVTITIGAISGQTFSGKVKRIFPTPTTTDNVKYYTVQIEPDSPFPDTVLPDMSAKISVETVHKENAASIPISCILRDSDKRQDYVYVCVDEREHIFEKRVVKTGVRDYDRVEILSGLKTDEKVALNPYLLPDSSITTTTTTTVQMRMNSTNTNAGGPQGPGGPPGGMGGAGGPPPGGGMGGGMGGGPGGGPGGR